MRELKILFCGLTALLVFPVSRLPAQGFHSLGRLGVLEKSGQSTQPVQSEQPRDQGGLHCLWIAQGTRNAVYFLGSIHELRKTDYPLPQILESAFANSQIAVFERDFSKTEDPNTLAVLRGKVTLPAGTTLRQLLPTPVYVSFSNHVEKAGLLMAKSFDSLKPAMAAEKLELIELVEFDAYFDYGLDQHFSKLAQQTGKQVVGLETTEFQTDLLADLSSSEQELMLETYLADLADAQERFNDMVSAWQNGDSAGLERHLNNLRTKAPSVFKKIVTDRNANWMPRFQQLLHGSQNAIVIVGAEHLVGPDGIVELLKKEGVRVTQL